MIGTTRNTSIATATALATGQSRFAKNSFHNTRPIIAAFGPPSISGITNSPTAGMNTRPQPATMPGSDSGSVIDSEYAPRRRAEIGRRFVQREVEPFERRIQRQRP